MQKKNILNSFKDVLGQYCAINQFVELSKRCFIADYNLEIQTRSSFIELATQKEITLTNSCSKVIHKNEPPEMDGFYYFSKDGGSFGKRTSSKLSNGPFLPERWSLVYSAFSSTSLSISFLA